MIERNIFLYFQQKSSLANALLGFDNLAAAINKKKRKELPFQIGHGLRSKTKATAFSTGR